MVDVPSEIAPPSCVAVLPVKVLLLIVNPIKTVGTGVKGITEANAIGRLA